MGKCGPAVKYVVRLDAEPSATSGPTDNALPLAPVRDPQTGHAISPVIAATLCIKPRRKLTADQAQKVDALKAESPSFTTIRHLAMRFRGILRGQQSAPLDAWVDSAIETGIPAIMRFARTLPATSIPCAMPSSFRGATVKRRAKSIA